MKTRKDLAGTCTKLRSKSKSKSSDKAIQKIYTPQKNQRHVDLDPKTGPNKTKPTSKAENYQSPQNKQKSRYKSTSQSRSKDKEAKTIKSKKKLVNSPYMTTKSKPKIVVVSMDKQKKLREDIQKCRLKIEDRQYTEAYKMLNRLNIMNPQNFQITYYLGLVSEMQNKVEEAKKLYRGCLKLSKSQGNTNNKNVKISPEKLQKLAKCNYYLNLFEDCIQICNKMLAAQRKSQTYETKGKAQLKLKKYGPAIDSISQAIQLDKNNFILYQYQGDCYKGIQAYELALNCYNKFSQFHTKQNINILEKKAECFKLLGNKKKQEQINEKIDKMRQLAENQLILIEEPIKSTKNIKGFDQTETLTNFGMLPFLRPHTPDISQAQQLFEKGNPELSLQIINKIIESEGPNVKNLHWSAFLHFQLQNYAQCQKKIDEAVKLLSNPILPLVTFLLPDPADNHMIQSLKVIKNKLKQLNAYSLTEQQDKFIMQRRKKCLQQALNVFKSRQMAESYKDSTVLNSKLTMIMQQSSIKSSRIYDTEESSIFQLRHIRKVLKNWCQNKFSLQSLEQTTDLAFSLVKVRYKQFSILPLHIIYHTFREQNFNKSFYQINERLSEVLSKMCKKYPPSQTDISKSQIGLFQIKWEKKPKVNLFNTLFPNSKPKFNSFKQLQKAIELVAAKASQQYSRMNHICKSICLEKHNGFGFKIGLKVQSNNQMIQQRVLNRVIQKMLSKQIKQKAANFFNDISVKPNKKLSQYMQDIEKKWESTIDEIIRQKNMNNEEITCSIYDFLRAKCMFISVKQIKNVVLSFIKAHSNGEIFLLEVDDRLASKTRDVVLKFKVKEIVGELQLALEFQSLQNQFNHGLYELHRSPFGPFFASFMWFSGFAMKKNQIFFKQKIKWALNGLQYLRKFIYQQQFPIILSNQSSQSLQLILIQFEIFSDTICCHITTSNHLYLKYNQNLNAIQSSIEKPKEKYIIKLVKDNFIIHEDNNYEIKLRIQSTQVFFTLDKNELKPILLENSITAQPLSMKMNQKLLEVKSNKGKYAYEEQIQECRKWQKKLVAMLDANY